MGLRQGLEVRTGGTARLIFFYDLPHPFRWFTANVGVHHVHHISSRVPYYRLPQVLRDFPELRQIGRISVMDSLRGVKLVLWDEASRRLISFREARALKAQAASLPRVRG